MSYEITSQIIPQARRGEINAKIVACIDSADNSMTKEEIYNTYTGLGGLHGLSRNDYQNYNEYAKAKQKVELGQFFTPHDLCRRIVEMVAPDPSEMILDMGCGMGNFFNFVPNHFNAYGIDIEPNAVKVAAYLYPDAHIQQEDLKYYDPQMRFDILLGNPPYNLEFDRELSQFFYCKKASDILNPAALMVLIVPMTFMASEFWDKSQVRAVENRFSFIGQAPLPADTFDASGVEEFSTKIMVFSHESSHIESRRYNAEEFVTMETLTSRIAEFRKLKESLKLQLLRETNAIRHAEEQEFNYKLKKYLYEIQTHPHLRDKYDQALALVSKFRNQKPPHDATESQRKEFEKSKLTYAKVLAVIRRYIRNQYFVPRREVALVKTSYTYKLKAYAPNLLNGVKVKQVPIYNLVIGGGGLPDAGEWLTPTVQRQYTQAEKLIRRKHRAFLRQDRPISEIEQDPELTGYIDSLRFYNKEMEACEFTPLQKFDMNRAFQKRNILLNWQQGSGKTAVAYHYAKYIRSQKWIHNPIVLAPANAIEMTWIPFLQRQNKRHVVVRHPSDMERVRPGEFIVVSLSILDRLEQALKGFIKRHSRKLCLIFDESDAITNEASQRTVRTLNVFRRVKFKILTTGTTTRNNVAELYSQLELLFNNSAHMMCDCSTVYFEEYGTHDIYADTNYYAGQPFPARGGARLFRACFCPTKTTVFGIEKRTQDIYNKDHLWALVEKSIITRKFREFAGDKYKILTTEITPAEGEKAVYGIIMKEFCRICYIYFNSTGDSRKEAGLKICRQIKLLIKACSVAHTMPGYKGNPFPQKVREIAQAARETPSKVAIGCTSIEAMEMYVAYCKAFIPGRPVFVVHGGIHFEKRLKIIDKFEATTNGILISTQQSLQSSINIPTCDDILIESMQWNIPVIEQFYFRFIRLDSKGMKRVRFFIYEQSIEQNLMALITTKERLNEFIKSGEVKEQSQIFEEFDVTPNLIENLLNREKDADGNFFLTWGGQKIAA